MKVPKQEQSFGCGTVIAVLCACFAVTTMFQQCDKSSETSHASSDRKITAWIMAQQFVERQLKSPSTASFGSILSDYQDPENVVTELGSGKYRVQAWVEAQNSFGATIRTHFVCELENTGSGDWYCTNLQL